MFVVTNRISVYSKRAQELEQRFRQRERRVQGAPGFEGMEILRPLPMRRNEAGRWERLDAEPETVDYEVRSYWRSLEDYEVWKESDSFQATHRRVIDDEKRADASRLPTGLVAGRPTIWFFEVLVDQPQS